jgi:subtilase family serine protease
MVHPSSRSPNLFRPLGYTFSSWSGDLSGTANPTSVTMNGPKTVMANFTTTSVTPTTYDFGNVKVKKNRTASFVVKNSGKTNLSITSAIIGTDVSMFTITSGGGSKTIKPGKTSTIKVAFKPTSKGSKSSNLEITSNDPVRPVIDIPLSGIGH